MIQKERNEVRTAGGLFDNGLLALQGAGRAAIPLKIERFYLFSNFGIKRCTE
jgi:hypothetical protein